MEAEQDQNTFYESLKELIKVFFFDCVMHANECTDVCTTCAHAEVRRRLPVTSAIVFCFIAIRQGLSLNWKVTI